VNSPPDAPPLAELQARFAAAIRAGTVQDRDQVMALADCIVDDGLPPSARIKVYRNNVRALFEGALARTYPVLRQRVGEDYFARLAAEYRQEHPSRSGDLHWTGQRFPEWIGSRMTGTDYAWLADLARLEWACEEVLVSKWLPPAPAESLARVPPEDLADALLSLQPGLSTVASAFPVWSVWQANQPGARGDAIDPSLGPQQVVVAADVDGLVLHSLAAEQFGFVEQLAAGRTLGQALEASGLAIEQLAATLRWLFGAGLVTAVSSSQDSITREDPS
jgi:hypothetical protein